MGYQTKLDLRTDTTIALGGSRNGKPNPTRIEGYYIGAKAVDTDYGPAKLHIFQTSEGTVGVWGKSNLDRLLTGDHKGQMCLVTFEGMGKAQKGRKPPYTYKLQYDADNTIEVGGVDVNTVLDQEDDVNADEEYEEIDPGAEEVALDEVKPARPVAARAPAAAPSSSSQKRLQELLGSRKSS